MLDPSTASVLSPATDRTAEMVSAAIRDIGKFSDLYNEHYSQVYYFIFRRTSEKELTFDLTSMVFLKAMENLKNYRYTGIPFTAWLYRIALNEIYGLHRKKKLDLVYNLDTARVQNLAQEIDGSDQEEMISIMLKSMQELHKEEMDLLEMRYFSGLSVKDIACILNVTESNTGVRIFRTLKKLKTIIKNNHHECL